MLSGLIRARIAGLRAAAVTPDRFRLVCFDMDGTLTTVPSSAFLGHALGYAEVAEERERRYAAGEMTNHDVAIGDAEHFRGRSKRDV